MLMAQLNDRSKPLLQTKLMIPKYRMELVSRDRLIEQLNQALNGVLTIVCAPTGYGKTMLVSEWIHTSNLAAAWVSLDEGDQNGAQMWSYLTAAIDGIRPGYLEEVKNVLPLLATENYEQALIIMLNELNRLSDPILLVLDDFHVIQEERLLRTVASFVKYLPEHVHLCLISRMDIGFPISRLVASGQVFCVDESQLRFSEEEGRLFFQSVQLPLDAEESSILVQRTEGWVAGLKLAALAVHNVEERSPFIWGFTGDNRFVKQYLLEEVWASLPDRLRRFLLKCSILKRWNASLCQTVSGFKDSAEMIGTLEQLHLFIVALDDKDRWYRFHHLFSEFLLQQLERDGEESEQSVALLYQAAGEWCRGQQLEEEAVEYFLLGGHYELAVEMLEKMTSKIVGWEWTSLGKWLSAIPSEVLLQHPVLFFSYVNALLAEDVRDLVRAEQLMSEADVWYEAHASQMQEEEQQRFLALAHYVRGTLMVFGYHDLGGARSHYEQVVHHAPKGIQMIFGYPEKPLQAETIRSYKIGLGQAVRSIAEPYTLQLAELYQVVNPVFLGRLFINYAEALYYWNDLESAEEYVLEGLKWAECNPRAAEHELVPGWIVQSRLKEAKGELSGAIEILEMGKRHMCRMDIKRGWELLDMEVVRLQLRIGTNASAAARGWLSGCRLKRSDRVSLYELGDYELFARALLLAGSWQDAGVVLEKLFLLAEQEMRSIDAIEIAAMRAMLYAELGEKEQALQELESALRISESNGFVRVLINEGTPMRGLLLELIEAKQHGYYRGRKASSLDFARRVLLGIDKEAASGADLHPFATILTKREMDIYQGLLDELTGKQIAQRLNIGYETVRTHRQRIYAKLGVKNREEAIRVAKELESTRDIMDARQKNQD